MRRALQSIWAAPRAPHPPGPLARDWVLVAIVVVAATLEAFLRTDVNWRPIVTAVVIGIAFTLPWRRVHPFGMFAIAFGSMLLLQVLSIAVAHGVVIALTTGVFILLLVYSVFRWGSGREGIAAVAILIAVVAFGFDRDYHSLAELLPEVAVLSIPILAAITVRAQTSSRARTLDHVRLTEREQLARELHDTVAHHVSAIVVRAQAGRVVGANDPAAAIDALSVIEAEGVRTLAEMRVLVGALRDSDDAALLTPRTASDITSLTEPHADGMAVEVSMSGDVDAVHPSVGAALYRIAQESVTNARRHAVRASQISIQLDVDDSTAHMVITDDGEPVLTSRAQAGYGIVGMTERVTLLGGTLSAGPGPERGWVVDVRVPRTGVSR